MQGTALATKQFDHRESDRVWTPWGSGCENAVRAIVDGRSADQFESFGAIEYPHHKQMRKAFDVGQARFEWRKNFKNALRLMLGAKALGDFLGVMVGTSHISDRLRRKHGIGRWWTQEPLPFFTGFSGSILLFSAGNWGWCGTQ